MDREALINTYRINILAAHVSDRFSSSSLSPSRPSILTKFPQGETALVKSTRARTGVRFSSDSRPDLRLRDSLSAETDKALPALSQIFSSGDGTMASIVYNGVSGGGGNLFEGIKFWIAQRVPTRNRLIDDVKNNGGSVVPLEKSADLLIADHARKDTPPGSHSWTYIYESVKNGKLEELEKHLIGASERYNRPVGSSKPAKLGRTPFTPADDRFLMAEMTKAERRGGKMKGNIIFQELEKINPRHTYQSWRDHWIKMAQHLPPPEGVDDDEEINSANQDSPVGRSVSSGRSSLPSDTQHESIQKVAVQPRKEFTRSEGRMLRNIYDDILNIEEAEWDAAWENFSKENPQHTAKEWEEFWFQIKEVVEKRKRKTVPLEAAKDAKATKFRSISPIPSTSQKKRAEFIEQPVNTLPPLPAEKTTTNIESSSLESKHDELSQFLTDLKDYAKAQDIDIPNLEPTVCGRKTSLFIIWRTMQLPEFGDFDAVERARRWAPFATKLNFNTFLHKTAPEELRSIYEDDLVDFDESRNQYLQNLQLQLEADAEDEVEHQVDDEEADENMDGDIDLDLPVLLAGSPKRGHQSMADMYSPTAVKRQKLAKGGGREFEIPSTPEDLYNAHFLTKSHHGRSPLRQQNSAKAWTVEENEEDAELSDDEDATFVPLQRNLFPTTVLEPETQDFHFLYPNLDAQLQEEEVDASAEKRIPASQLQNSEELVHDSPIKDSSTQSQEESDREGDELLAFVDHYVALGYENDIVVKALLATTMETADVGHVIESLAQKKGIPSSMGGVWTKVDDKALDTNNMVEAERVLRKHGKARCERRRQFLQNRNDALNEIQI